jgi:hypothetical protein
MGARPRYVRTRTRGRNLSGARGHESARGAEAPPSGVDPADSRPIKVDQFQAPAGKIGTMTDPPGRSDDGAREGGSAGSTAQRDEGAATNRIRRGTDPQVDGFGHVRRTQVSGLGAPRYLVLEHGLDPVTPGAKTG